MGVEMSAQRIAILGAGDVAGTLGSKWLATGHQVVFGVRNPDSENVAALRARLGDQAEVDTIAGALSGSDVVLIAISGGAVAELVSDHGQQLDGRIVIDATNQRVKGQAEATGEWGERHALNSVGVVREHAPGAAVYRAFNSYAWEVFANPVFGDRRADLFYCGPEGDGRVIVEQLIGDVGLRPVRVGDLDRVEAVDNVLELWASLAMFEGKGRASVAFAMLDR